MQKALLIAEKPSLMRTIKEVYDRHKNELDYTCDFLSQRGHLLTLKLPDEIDEKMKKYSWDTLPFFPDQHGGWQYRLVKEKKTEGFKSANERFAEIRSALHEGDYDFIIHAGDPDQEGELLINIVINKIGTDLPVMRFWTNDLTEKKVLEALKNLRDDRKDKQLVNLFKAAVVRQHKDYEFGMNISRAASMKMNGVVATGRVMTYIQAAVVRRDYEIETFKPRTKYGVVLDYGDGFKASLFSQSEASETDEDSDDEKKGIVWFDKKEDAEEILNTLLNKSNVLIRKATTGKKFAPKLFKLSSLQEHMDKKGYNPKEVTDICQAMYEKKITTYVRTSCEYMSGNEDFEGIIDALSGIDELKPYTERITEADISRVKKMNKWINPKEHEKQGHSALTPTTEPADMSKLTEQEKEVYIEIAKRFLAIFLPPYEFETVEIITENNGHSFKTTGKTTLAKGYTEIFGKSPQDGPTLPMCAIGDELSVISKEVSEVTSKCPPYLTQGNLISICENPTKYLEDKKYKSLGKRLVIGTEATRAAIIQKLIYKYGYLELFNVGKKEYVRSTPKGRAIIDNMKDLIICKPDMTGEWEIQLEQIRQGEDTAEHIEAQTKRDIVEMLEEIKATEMKSLNQAAVPTDLICPKCGKNLIKYGWGYRCSGYKKDNPEEGCSFTLGLNNDKLKLKLDETDVKTLLAGNETQPKKMWSEKKQKYFRACVYIDKEDDYRLKFKFPSNKTDYTCPMCGSPIIKVGSGNHEGFKCSCEKDPSCSFIFWRTQFGKKISDGHIEEFFTDGITGPISGFKKKSGGTYTARLKADAEGRVTLDFNRKPYTDDENK